MQQELLQEYFRELIKALSGSTSAITTVSDKMLSLEKSMEKINSKIESVSEEMEMVVSIIKNGRLKEILDLLSLHHDFSKTHPAACQKEMQTLVSRALVEVICSRDFHLQVQRALKAQLDPSDPENNTPIVMKNRIKDLELKDFLSAKFLTFFLATVSLVVAVIEVFLKSQ